MPDAPTRASEAELRLRRIQLLCQATLNDRRADHDERQLAQDILEIVGKLDGQL